MTNDRLISKTRDANFALRCFRNTPLTFCTHFKLIFSAHFHKLIQNQLLQKFNFFCSIFKQTLEVMDLIIYGRLHIFNWIIVANQKVVHNSTGIDIMFPLIKEAQCNSRSPRKHQKQAFNKPDRNDQIFLCRMLQTVCLCHRLMVVIGLQQPRFQRISAIS